MTPPKVMKEFRDPTKWLDKNIMAGKIKKSEIYFPTNKISSLDVVFRNKKSKHSSWIKPNPISMCRYDESRFLNQLIRPWLNFCFGKIILIGDNCSKLTKIVSQMIILTMIRFSSSMYNNFDQDFRRHFLID